LVSEEQRKQWAEYFETCGIDFVFFSAVEEQEKIDELKENEKLEENTEEDSDENSEENEDENSEGETEENTEEIPEKIGMSYVSRRPVSLDEKKKFQTFLKKDLSEISKLFRKSQNFVLF